MNAVDYIDYLPITSDPDYFEEWDDLEEDVVREKNKRKLGNAFKQKDSDAI